MGQSVSAVEVRQKLGEILNRVSLRREEIIIERAGKKTARLSPIDNDLSRSSGKLDFHKAVGLDKFFHMPPSCNEPAVFREVRNTPVPMRLDETYSICLNIIGGCWRSIGDGVQMLRRFSLNREFPSCEVDEFLMYFNQPVYDGILTKILVPLPDWDSILQWP